MEIKLKDFIGKHKLSGVDYVPSPEGNNILFCLDGIKYILVENEYDGYRSYMDGLDITDKKISHVFPAQVVECVYEAEIDNWESDILFMFSLDGKLILEIGTEMVNDQYPCAVFAYYPENMDINSTK
ncbi:hypothetical protein MCI89_14465 [Muricomes sp. OA1]|uniref:Uncharacterized protein n=1 Tax=Faecalicatena contorta TaxID=39482 RepID=A0A174F2L2_9FIRM|nr:MULTISPECIES: hypothetical protein [Clostridia]MCH1973547.1 hypothetical protein [Muricomes sp. OA1]MDU7708499.1 hypothetical protein [Clostridium sp.]CUO44463.1 Uncharacterised protein [[Eubacterium] contortum] [Faecalicatena contorta]